MSHEMIVARAIMGELTPEQAIRQASLLTAVQTAMFCRQCGGILDASKAVYVERRSDEKPMMCLCAPCWDSTLAIVKANCKAKRVKSTVDEVYDVVDGRTFNWDR